jgi:hypothetical protein
MCRTSVVGSHRQQVLSSVDPLSFRLVRSDVSADRWHSRVDNTCLRVPADALHEDSGGDPGSGRPIFRADVAAVAAPVLLAGGLPAHAQLACDLRPSDTETDGVIHQQRELGLRLLLREPGAPDSLQRLLCRSPENTLRRASWVRSWGSLPLLILPEMPVPPRRLPLSLWHVVQTARREATTQLVWPGQPERLGREWQGCDVDHISRYR